MNYTLDARGESENRNIEVLARGREVRLMLRELDRELAALMAEAKAANLTGTGTTEAA